METQSNSTSANRTYMPTNMEVFRRRRDWTQSYLGSLVGKTQAQISHYENGFNIPTSKVRAQIEIALNIPAGKLLAIPEIGDTPL